MASDPTSYDDVPYTSFPYARTHPDRLCSIARLFGVEAASPGRARVLELGCAAGGNLAPMAERLPDSEFVGVDLSARQVEAGKELARAAGLTNLELRHASITDVDASWGRFDYVICHGVYSWVPAAVQEAILRICQECTTPDGIAYISYNTYPGWHLRDAVRHMMRYHVRGLGNPDQRVKQARALIDFLARAAAEQSGPYALLLQKELALLSRSGDDYVYHEHLEEDNRPVYFHEFVDRLRGHDLQYLAETDIHMMLTRGMDADTRQTLDRVSSDIISLEQYADFVRNRQFRASLVCKAGVPLRRSLGPDSIMAFRIGFAAKGGPIDLSPGLAQEFENADSMKITSSLAITKAALVVLRQMWPLDLAFAELFTRARGLLGEAGIPAADDDGSRVALAADLLECLVAGGGIDLRTEPPPLVTHLSIRPRAPRVARVQALRHSFATSGRHLRLDLDTVAREVVIVADGTRDETEMLEHLVALAEGGRINLRDDAGPLTDPPRIREALRSALNHTLTQLAACGLFEA